MFCGWCKGIPPQKNFLVKPKLIIFDLEGTLIDTMDVYRFIFKQATKNLGFKVNFDEKLFKKMLDSGFSEREIISSFLKKENKLHSFMREVEKIALKMFNRYSKPLCNLKKLFLTLKSKGFFIAIFTNMEGNKEIFKMIFPWFSSVEDLIDVVVTRWDVKNKKPAPDGVLECAKRLGIPPNMCLMVGDSSIDIKAGKLAGAQTVAVLSGVGSLKTLKRESPDIIVSNVEELIFMLS